MAAWSPWTEADKDCLERVQRRAVGMVTGLVGRTYEEKLRELDLCTLEERRHQLDMLQVYKILHGRDDVEKEQWFEPVGDGGMATRLAADPLNMRIPAPRLDIRKHFFSQRVPRLWNEIPATVKQAKTVAGFRNQYKKIRKERALIAGDR